LTRRHCRRALRFWAFMKLRILVAICDFLLVPSNHAWFMQAA
jgi:hypothetical protein